MESIKLIVARNLAELRKSKGLTQGELADKFNYSDKSISKWERGESIPDIETLKQLCDFYGVTLDFLVNENAIEEKKKYQVSKGSKANHIIITALAVSVAWIVAVAICIGLVGIYLPQYCWLPFIWALPVTFIIMIIFYAIWTHRTRWNAWLVTSLVWTLITAIYLQLCMVVGHWETYWILFIAGIPLTIAAFLWGGLAKRKNK